MGYYDDNAQSGGGDDGGFSGQDFAAGYGAGQNVGSGAGEKYVRHIEGKRDYNYAKRKQRAAYNTSLGGLMHLLGIGAPSIAAHDVVMQDINNLKSGDDQVAAPPDTGDAGWETIRYFAGPTIDGRPTDPREGRNHSSGWIERDGVMIPPKKTVDDPRYQALERLKAQGIRLDQVVMTDSPEARYLRPGTIIARRPGDKGMDPRIAAARQQTYGVLSNTLIDEQDLGRLQTTAATQVGSELGLKSTTNFQQAAGQLQGLGGAGIASAAVDTSSALANREFNMAARTNARMFLSDLYGNASGVI